MPDAASWDLEQAICFVEHTTVLARIFGYTIGDKAIPQTTFRVYTPSPMHCAAFPLDRTSWRPWQIGIRSRVLAVGAPCGTGMAMQKRCPFLHTFTFRNYFSLIKLTCASHFCGWNICLHNSMLWCKILHSFTHSSMDEGEISSHRFLRLSLSHHHLEAKHVPPRNLALWGDERVWNDGLGLHGECQMGTCSQCSRGRFQRGNKSGGELAHNGGDQKSWNHTFSMVLLLLLLLLFFVFFFLPLTLTN